MNKSKHIRSGDGNVCVTDMCEKSLSRRGRELAGERAFSFHSFTHYKTLLFVLVG